MAATKRFYLFTFPGLLTFLDFGPQGNNPEPFDKIITIYALPTLNTYQFMMNVKKKKRIRETPNLSTDANRSTDTEEKN